MNIFATLIIIHYIKKSIELTDSDNIKFQYAF